QLLIGGRKSDNSDLKQVITMNRDSDLLTINEDDVAITGNVTVAGSLGADAETDDGNSSTADTIDWGNSNFHKSTLTGDVTYTFTAPSAVGIYILKVVQDSTARTITWPA